MSLLAAVMLVATLAPSTGATSTGQEIRWEKSFKDALKKARTEGRPILVDFWAEWCHWCHELDATTYRDPKVVASAASFVAVKVDTEGSLGEKEISADYDVEILPTIAFLSPRGHVVLRRDKFEGPEAFAATLETAGRMAGDVMAWEDALSRDANDPEALARLGTHLFSQRQPDDSRELLERAAKHDAGRPVGERKHTRVLLGTLRLEAEHYGDAEKLLQSALALEPPDAAEDAVALLRLGEASLKRGRTEAARAAWTRAVATEPGGATATQARQALETLPH
jgi:thioredoxin-like negative regulator of GroEL